MIDYSFLAAPSARAGSYFLPEEEEALLKRVAKRSLGGLTSGLAWLGESLDKPGAAIRGVLGGEFEQLLNLIPFSDTMGLTHVEDRVSGRDLLEKLGMVAKNKPGLAGWSDAGGDVAGFGAEVLLDPLTYATFGLNQAGKAARAVGVLGRGTRVERMGGSLNKLLAALPAAERIEKAAQIEKIAGGAEQFARMGDESLQGLVNLGIPFTGIEKTFGTGELAQKFAGRLDTGSNWLKSTRPVRAARAAFDPTVQGQYPAMGQEAGVLGYDAKKAGRIAGSEGTYQFEQRMDEIHDIFDESFGEMARGENPANMAIGSAFETGDVVRAADRGNYGRVQGVFDDGVDVHFTNPDTLDEKVVRLAGDQLSVSAKRGSKLAGKFQIEQTRSVLDRIVRHAFERSEIGGRAAVDEAFDLIMPKAGRASDSLASSIEKHVGEFAPIHRELRDEIAAKGGKIGLIEDEGFFSHFGRFITKRAKSGGTPMERLLQVGNASMNRRTEAIANIPTEIVNAIRSDVGARGDDAVEYISTKYNRWLGSGYEDVVEEGVGLIEAKVGHAQDVAKWVTEHDAQWGKYEGRLFNNPIIRDELKYQRGMNTSSRTLDAVHEMLKRHVGEGEMPLGVVWKSGDEKIGMMNGTESLAHFAKLTGKTVEEVAQLNVPNEAINAANALLDFTAKKGGWQRAVFDTLSKATDHFKQNVTLPFPGFGFRNHASGQAANINTGLMKTPKDLMLYMKEYYNAWRMMKEGADPEFLGKIKAHNVIGGDVGQEGVARVGTIEGTPTFGEAWNVRQNYRDVAQRVADNPSIVDKVPFGRAARRVHGTLLATGSKANQQVEWMNRVPLQLYLTKHKGWDFGEAAKAVLERQFDYSDITSADQGMKLMFPFWTFTKKVTVLTARNLAERPGGLMAQSMRASNQLRGSTGNIMPDYVASTASIPMPGGPEGSDRYLSSFGMFYEDPLSFLGGGIRGGGLEALSRMNPIFKGPAEYFTGTSFFQRGPGGGRRLEDLDPTVGRLLANLTGSKEPIKFPGSELFETVIANSPLTRYASTARTLTDTRKGPGAKALNLTTGARITDVSEGSKDAILREYVRQQMAATPGSRTFERLHFPKAFMEELKLTDPQQYEQNLTMSALMNALAKRSKRRYEMNQQRLLQTM